MDRRRRCGRRAGRRGRREGIAGGLRSGEPDAAALGPGARVSRRRRQWLWLRSRWRGGACRPGERDAATSPPRLRQPVRAALGAARRAGRAAAGREHGIPLRAAVGGRGGIRDGAVGRRARDRRAARVTGRAAHDRLDRPLARDVRDERCSGGGPRPPAGRGGAVAHRSHSLAAVHRRAGGAVRGANGPGPRCAPARPNRHTDAAAAEGERRSGGAARQPGAGDRRSLARPALPSRGASAAPRADGFLRTHDAVRRAGLAGRARVQRARPGHRRQARRLATVGVRALPALAARPAGENPAAARPPSATTCAPGAP